MDTRLTATQGIWQTVHRGHGGAGPSRDPGSHILPAAASPTACRVQNSATGKTYAALQVAVDAALQG